MSQNFEYFFEISSSHHALIMESRDNGITWSDPVFLDHVIIPRVVRSDKQAASHKVNDLPDIWNEPSDRSVSFTGYKLQFPRILHPLFEVTSTHFLRCTVYSRVFALLLTKLTIVRSLSCEQQPVLLTSLLWESETRDNKTSHNHVMRSNRTCLLASIVI